MGVPLGPDQLALHRVGARVDLRVDQRASSRSQQELARVRRAPLSQVRPARRASSCAQFTR